MGPDYRVAGTRRTGPGQVEVHDKETDIIYITDGEATIVTGGKMLGGKQTRADQWLGTDIQGGDTRHLVKRDMVVVPAFFRVRHASLSREEYPAGYFLIAGFT